MIRPPPRSTRTDTLFPYTTLFRSTRLLSIQAAGRSSAFEEMKEKHDDGGLPNDARGRRRDDDDRYGPDRAPNRRSTASRYRCIRELSAFWIYIVAAAETRSEARRVGKECVSTFRYRGSRHK